MNIDFGHTHGYTCAYGISCQTNIALASFGLRLYMNIVTLVMGTISNNCYFVIESKLLERSTVK